MTATDPLLHTLVAGRYRIERRLGEGGMGHVYLATHLAIEKPVALKVLKQEYSAKEEIVSRFQREAISASRVKHPNVLEVFDFGKLDNGCTFLAMEYLAGHDLADELNANGTVETSRALRIALQLARGLASAHKAGVVHRDMKPDNVFLARTDDGEEIVKIVDFGIAQLRLGDEAERNRPNRRRLTRTGMIFGTPEYMAPEQAAGKNADQRVDIYASGIILFEMLTGDIPFTGDSFMGVLNAHLHAPIPRVRDLRPDLQISAELEACILRCLDKEPAARFQTMTELAAALLQTPEAGALPSTPEAVSVATLQMLTALPEARNLGPSRTVPEFTPPGTTLQTPTPSSNREPVVNAMGEHPTLAAAPTPKSPAWIIAGVALALAAAVLWVAPRFRGQQPAPTPDAVVGQDRPAVIERQPEPAAKPSPNAEQPPVVEATAAAAANAGAASAGASAEAAAETTVQKVRVHVETTPPGAIVKHNGFQVCDATPCDVDFDQGARVELEASVGKFRGRAKVLAQKAQTVTIPLVTAAAAKPAMCEALSADGLKILRPCPR